MPTGLTFKGPLFVPPSFLFPLGAGGSFQDPNVLLWVRLPSESQHDRKSKALLLDPGKLSAGDLPDTSNVKG